MQENTKLQFFDCDLDETKHERLRLLQQEIDPKHTNKSTNEWLKIN